MQTTGIEVEASSSPRNVLADYVWNKAVEHFTQGDFANAEASFAYCLRLTELSDEEYEQICHCDNKHCYCNK